MKGAVDSARRDECKIRSAMRQVTVPVAPLSREESDNFNNLLGAMSAFPTTALSTPAAGDPAGCYRREVLAMQWRTCDEAPPEDARQRGRAHRRTEAFLHRQTPGIPAP